ncbi:MAG: hypothetical protein JKY65_10505 [Planctomycetes bacterium]|nr:hypothetical protein [Planctomycetota bacterium]
MSDDPVFPLDRDRIARKLWGDDALDAEEHFYATSSDEEIAILRECVRELQGGVTALGIQQVQLELTRGRRFNEFEGEEIVRDLLAHRSLWTSALMDWLGDPSGLIKLRDLSRNRWNVDTLNVLARDEGCARELVEASTEWKAESVVVYGAGRTTRAIGCSSTPARVLAWWWD